MRYAARPASPAGPEKTQMTAGVAQFVAHMHHFQLRRLSMKTITATQATLSPTPRTRNAGHPFSMLPVSTLNRVASKLRLDRACLAQGIKGRARRAAQRDQESGGVVAVHFDGLA